MSWRGEIVGHRGAAGLAPENTMAAFEAGLAAGSDRIEFDVRATLDGAVVFHDARLDRFHGTHAAFGKTVGRMTTAELVRIDAGAAFGRRGCFVPTYGEVLDVLKGRVKLNVEAKGSGADGIATVAACIRGIREHDLVADTILSSFHAPVLQHALEIAPEVPRAFIADGRTSGDPIDLARSVESVALHAGQEIVDDRLLARCREVGLALRVWTVNDENVMRRLVDMDVDGIVTDYPDRLRRLAGR